MKKANSMIIMLVLILSTLNAGAQKIPDSSAVNPGKMYLIIKNDGTQFMGKIVFMDAREILIDTKKIGQVSIPKHEIKQMKEVKASEVSANGDYKPSETFATRYFITTNGLPIEKGESYILWNWYGPDIQFGVGKNFGIGIMTSWFAMPVIASAKYSITLDENTHLAIGTLLGTGSWTLPHFGLAVPFGSLTYGNRRSNITFSGGYGAIWGYGSDGGRVLCSVAGMTKVTNKASLVFDSFILPGNGNNKEYTAIYMPGIRLQTASNKAWIATHGTFSPFPMLQWFRMLLCA